jgi:hypothetical protein
MLLICKTVTGQYRPAGVQVRVKLSGSLFIVILLQYRCPTERVRAWTILFRFLSRGFSLWGNRWDFLQNQLQKFSRFLFLQVALTTLNVNTNF